MSAVFGIYRVVSVEKSGNKEFPYALNCIDPDTDERPKISSRKPYPIGTVINWEYDCKTDRVSLQVQSEEEEFVPNKAYIVYWDSEKEIIKQTTMYAETLWPIPLTQAVKSFRPEFAAGANVTFESITGELSEIVVFKF